jgi:ketosteroid isomerase-like protein
MNLKLIFLLILFTSIQAACRNNDIQILKETYRKEILKTEEAFAEMAKEQGLKKAFTKYAADNAVLKRGNDLIIGKKAIEEYYANYQYRDAELQWQPDYIDVSESGDLAYTYGRYTFKAILQSGEVLQDTGIFHTVWKRQPDGQWRYVWD